MNTGSTGFSVTVAPLMGLLETLDLVKNQEEGLIATYPTVTGAETPDQESRTTLNRD